MIVWTLSPCMYGARTHICILIHIRMAKETHWAVCRLQNLQINILAFENLLL